MEPLCLEAVYLGCPTPCAGWPFRSLTCLRPWPPLRPPPSPPAKARLRFERWRKRATSPRLPRHTFRSPRERVAVLDKCSGTFRGTSSLAFPDEWAWKGAPWKNGCKRQLSEHGPRNGRNAGDITGCQDSNQPSKKLLFFLGLQVPSN